MNAEKQVIQVAIYSKMGAQLQAIAERYGITADEALYIALDAGIKTINKKPPVTNGRPFAVKSPLNQLLIYDLWASKAKTQAELAEEYGISIRTVGRIIRKQKPSVTVAKR